MFYCIYFKNIICIQKFFFESGSHCATQSDLKLTLSASVCLLRLRQATPYLVNMIFSYAQQRVTMIEHTYLSLHVALLLCVATTSKIYSCQKNKPKQQQNPKHKNAMAFVRPASVGPCISQAPRTFIHVFTLPHRHSKKLDKQ